MWPYILGASLVLICPLVWLVQNVSNKQVSKLQKGMLLYFWFLSFFPLILIPTEVILKVEEGGAALSSSLTKKEMQISRAQSMYEQEDVPIINKLETNSSTGEVMNKHKVPDENDFKRLKGSFEEGQMADPKLAYLPLNEKSKISNKPEVNSKTKKAYKKQKINNPLSNSKINNVSIHQRTLEEAHHNPSVSYSKETFKQLTKAENFEPKNDIESPGIELVSDISVSTVNHPNSKHYSTTNTDLKNSEASFGINNNNHPSGFVNYMMEHKNDHFLYELWLCYYFCNFMNGWLLLPLVIYYFRSGEFYFKTKLLDSIRYNLKYYFVMIIIMVVILLILVFQHHDLKGVFRVSLSIYNSLCYLIFLVSMAHGVARIPAKYLRTRKIQELYAKQVNTFLSKKQKYSQFVLAMNEYYYVWSIYSDDYILVIGRFVSFN